LANGKVYHRKTEQIQPNNTKQQQQQQRKQQQQQ
jgi:hypothetical protein